MLMRPKQRVEGSGAAGARPPLASLHHPVYLPEWGAVARGFWGSKFPLGVPYLHPSLPLYLPRAPHKFSPHIFSIYQIFQNFSPGEALFTALAPRPAGPR